MCGIVGIFSYQAKTIEENKIKLMNDSISRRGPDDEGYYISQDILLGMRRLSIIDIASGHQPIFNEDKSIVIVFNGEIFNHNELRENLIAKGYNFTTRSDTEVIVHLYEEHGIDCLQQLRGMFGFCIWDMKLQKGYLCRDRFGIKPMYTAHTKEGSFIFASELKAILANGGIEKEISIEGLDAYLAYNYIPAPLTIYTGVYKLPAAHYIEFDRSLVSIPIKYWDANDSIPIEQPYEKNVERLLVSSVNYHMESDVPVGTFLSGGIDSSLVTAIASSHKNFSSTYTIGFSDTSRIYDERPLARQVAEKYGVKNTIFATVEPKPDETLTAAIKAFDEPFADDSIIPTWEICALASKDLKVCLTGLGGDEAFGGYYRYLGITYYQIYAKLPLIIRKSIYQVAKRIFIRASSRKINHLMRFVDAGRLSAENAYTMFLTALDEKERGALYAKTICKKPNPSATKDLIRSHFNRCNETSLLKKAIYADINTYVPEDILTLSDRVSMWHSLELRVPLMDHIVFEGAFKLPDSEKINRKTKKILLRKIARKYLPEDLFRAKKQGFESPMAEWINTKLKDYVDKLLSPESLELSGFFDVASVQQLLNDHRRNIKDNSKIIFSLLMFQVWYEECFRK